MACCGTKENENEVLTPPYLTGAMSADKLRRIVKIQAAFRGYMTRKRVKAIRDNEGVKSMMNHFNFQGPANYDNPEVQVTY